MCLQDPAKFTGSMVDIADPDMPQVHLALAFQGVSWTDPDAVPLMVMQTMLGTLAWRALNACRLPLPTCAPAWCRQEVDLSAFCVHPCRQLGLQHDCWPAHGLARCAADGH